MPVPLQRASSRAAQMLKCAGAPAPPRAPAPGTGGSRAAPARLRPSGRLFGAPATFRSPGTLTAGCAPPFRFGGALSARPLCSRSPPREIAAAHCRRRGTRGRKRNAVQHLFQLDTHTPARSPLQTPQAAPDAGAAGARTPSARREEGADPGAHPPARGRLAKPDPRRVARSRHFQPGRARGARLTRTRNAHPLRPQRNKSWPR